MPLPGRVKADAGVVEDQQAPGHRRRRRLRWQRHMATPAHGYRGEGAASRISEADLVRLYLQMTRIRQIETELNCRSSLFDCYRVL